MVQSNKKVLAYIASPHKDGNTAYVINEIVKKLTKSNVNEQVYYACDFNVKPCKGCFYCKDKNICAIDDDMSKIYKEFKTTDLFIFGSPIYMGQMSGQGKVFLDRLFPQLVPKFSPYYNPKTTVKKVILVFTQGNPDKNKFQTYIKYIEESFEILGFEVVGTLLVYGTRETPALTQNNLDSKINSLCESV